MDNILGQCNKKILEDQRLGKFTSRVFVFKKGIYYSH
jgi:hypothetical protein